jgi:hypothetical protein
MSRIMIVILIYRHQKPTDLIILFIKTTKQRRGHEISEL